MSPIFFRVLQGGGESWGTSFVNCSTLGVPPWSLSLSKNYRDFELSFLGILVFRGTFCSIRLKCDPVSTNSDLFQVILPGGTDLFSPMSSYFAGQA